MKVFRRVKTLDRHKGIARLYSQAQIETPRGREQRGLKHLHVFDLGFGFLTAHLAEVIHNNLQICLIAASIMAFG